MIISFARIDAETIDKAEEIFESVRPKFEKYLHETSIRDKAWELTFNELSEEEQRYLDLATGVSKRDKEKAYLLEMEKSKEI